MTIFLCIVCCFIGLLAGAAIIEYAHKKTRDLLWRSILQGEKLLEILHEKDYLLCKEKLRGDSYLKLCDQLYTNMVDEVIKERFLFASHLPKRYIETEISKA